MDGIRKRYRILIIVVLIIMSISIGALFFITLKRIDDTNHYYSKESIINLKKTFLKDTVNNVILEIEQKQEEQVEYYRHLSDDIGKALDRYYRFTRDTFVDSCMNDFERQDNITDFTLFIIEKATGDVVFSRITSADTESPTQILKSMESKCPVWTRKDYGEYEVVWGVDKNVIDEKVKTKIHDDIHRYLFSNDAYIWVNEVIHYEGGDNYAIRRIHPNLKDTEGSYLSTNMTDIKGNFPYLTELEGVKEYGELFFNYYFKKKNSDSISEKVTYAKLYKEYNWIIAMGVHLDDVQAYVDQTASQSKRDIKKMMTGVTALTIALISSALILVSVIERWYHMKSTKLLMEEACRDPLTNTYNRRTAQKQLSIAWQSYKYTGINSAIIMIDIDDFKKINDKCGHDKGDAVLVKIAEIFGNYIRSTDILCRWGGEEFLLICSGLKKEDIIPFTEKLLQAVTRVEYECNEIKSSITISIGASCFTESDADYNAAVKRADVALYRSKDQGKNQTSIEC